MKLGYWTYLIAFLVFFGLVIAIMAQNLSWSWEVSVLWMKTNVWVLVIVVGILWIIQGMLLLQFIRSFFITMQRWELTKFDLDKPL
jgi:hypothetical protein